MVRLSGEMGRRQVRRRGDGRCVGPGWRAQVSCSQLDPPDQLDPNGPRPPSPGPGEEDSRSVGVFRLRGYGKRRPGEFLQSMYQHHTR